MKLNVFFLVFATIVCSAVLVVCSEHVDASVKICPLGDSITRGGMESDSAYPSYRYHLWTMLRSGGYDVDFVGSTTDPSFVNYAFDQDHDGHSGYKTEDLATNMETLLINYTPDIVLLYIGTNDVLQQVDMDDRMRNIGKIVNMLRVKNPNVKILLAQIAPTGDKFRNENSGLVEFNTKLLTYANTASSTASPIVIVDMYTAWSTEIFTQGDGIHPNNEGELQLAQRWANALISTGMISPSVATPVPTTVITTIPPTVITTMPTTVPTAVITTVQTAVPTTIASSTTTRSAFGSKRYALRPGAAGLGIAGARTQVTLSPGSSSGSNSGDTNPLIPPTRAFQRWYPGQRWASGMK
jgi:hypothetical protein